MSDLRVVPAAPAMPIGPVPSRGRSRRHLPALVGLLASLLVVMSFASYAFPGVADAASTLATKCSGVALRTSPYTSATVKVRLGVNVRVTVPTSVSGGRWSTYCAGASKSGSTWFRISAIGGRSVKSLYGVTYLYGASSLFKTVIVPATLYTACSSTFLRTSPSTTATSKASLPRGATLVVYGAVTGTAWSVACPTSTKGTAWYRVTSVNGKSVSSVYRVSYLYVATGTMTSTKPAVAPTPTPKPSATPTPTPTPIPIGTPPPVQPNACFPPPSPTPTPVPTPTPTPDPSASPSATPTPTATPSPTPTPAWNCVAGLDVSHYQYTIDWSKVAQAGYKFAFVKAVNGKTGTDPTGCPNFCTDSYYASNRANANANKIAIGAYDFGQPSAAAGSGTAEADYFVGVATPKSGDLVPVLDLESYIDPYTGLALSPAQMQTWVRDWLYEVYARTGIRAMIYVSPYFWSTRMGNTTWFAQNGFRTLWIAHWGVTSPSVPASIWGGYSWTFWQWTSSGTVPGIGGRVDLDRFHYADLTPYRIP